MLEGLEAVEIKLNQCKNIIDFRIDANTYKKDYIKTENLIASAKHLSIEELSTSVQNFGAYSLCNYINFVDIGIPFLVTENIRYNYINWNVKNYIDAESHQMLWKSHCKKNQVLITMAGEYLGRVAVYDKDNVCSSNQAIAKITLKEGVYPYYVSTFLNSRHGQNQINRLKTITGQPNINMSLIKVLEVVLPSIKFQEKTTDLIKFSHLLALKSQTLYSEAENILLEELGLNDWQPTIKNNNTKTLKESFLETGRMDAEYYQPKYDELELAINKFKTINFKTLTDYPIVSGSTPKAGESEYYTNEKDGIPFIRAVDIINGKVSLENPVYIKSHVHNILLKRTQLKKGDVLISIAGTVGRSGVFDHDIEANINQACAILRFKENEVLHLYLMMFINSKIGQLIIEKVARQGVQTNLNLEELGSISIPVINIKTQQIIAREVEESFVLHQQSKKLLEAAKKAVELAIEEGEDVGIKYLEDVTNQMLNYEK